MSSLNVAVWFVIERNIIVFLTSFINIYIKFCRQDAMLLYPIARYLNMLVSEIIRIVCGMANQKFILFTNLTLVAGLYLWAICAKEISWFLQNVVTCGTEICHFGAFIGENISPKWWHFRFPVVKFAFDVTLLLYQDDMLLFSKLSEWTYAVPNFCHKLILGIPWYFANSHWSLGIMLFENVFEISDIQRNSDDMMTSSNGNIFHVIGHLCGEFAGHRWIPLTKASDKELWYFLLSAPE